MQREPGLSRLPFAFTASAERALRFVAPIAVTVEAEGFQNVGSCCGAVVFVD
jgi:hypothetical protein